MTTEDDERAERLHKLDTSMHPKVVKDPRLNLPRAEEVRIEEAEVAGLGLDPQPENACGAEGRTVSEPGTYTQPTQLIVVHCARPAGHDGPHTTRVRRRHRILRW